MNQLFKMYRAHQPTYWQHSSLTMHKKWFSRRAWQYRARAGLIAIAVLLLIIWLTGSSPWWLLLAGLAVFVPVPSPLKTLQEIEATTGEAYTTALTATQDQFGFYARLEKMASSVQKNVDLPSLPWLEGAGVLVLLSLLLVLPAQKNQLANNAADRAVTQASLENSNQPNTNSDTSQPVLDAPSRDAPAGNGDAKPGQAASGGSASEENLGALKPGGGNANEDPAAISKEFLEALERGAVRDRDPSKATENGGKVEDANPPTAGQSGSNSGKENGQQGEGAGQNGQKNNQNGQQGNQNGQGQNSQGQNGQQGNQNGAQTGKNGQGTQSNGNQNGQNGTSQNGKNGQGNKPNNPDRNNVDRGEDYQGFDPNNKSGGGGSRTTSPGQGARDAQGNPVAADRKSGKGKLEYLQGTARGDNVRSGALQMAGDPKNGFTSPTGSAAYRRAAESAVLDPRLPPEYQEMLRNYYR